MSAEAPFYARQRGLCNFSRLLMAIGTWMFYCRKNMLKCHLLVHSVVRCCVILLHVMYFLCAVVEASAFKSFEVDAVICDVAVAVRIPILPIVIQFFMI